MENNQKKTYTLQKLADEYKVDRRTIYNWLLPIRKELMDMYPFPKKRIGILLPKQAKRIYEFLG